MRITNTRTPEQYTDRWLARRAPDLTPLSTEARSLLTNRLAARRRNVRILMPIYVLVLALGLSGPVFIAVRGLLIRLEVVGSEQDLPVGWANWVFPVGVLFLALLGMLNQELDLRADRRIAGALTHRITRGCAVPLRAVLGNRGTRFLNAALIVDSMVLIGLVASDNTWVSLLHFGIFALVGLLAASSIRRALNRLSVATDQISLAIDERLRHLEAIGGAGILMIFVTVEIMAMGSVFNIWLLLFSGAAILVLLVMYYLSSANTPGQVQQEPIAVAPPARKKGESV